MQNLACENEFYLHKNKNHFHISGFALRIALKPRLGATQKWLIDGDHCSEPLGGGVGVLPSRLLGIVVCNLSYLEIVDILLII